MLEAVEVHAFERQFGEGKTDGSGVTVGERHGEWSIATVH